MAEGQRLIDPVAVDRQAGGPPHPLVMPRRFRVPLIRKVDVEHTLDDRWLQGQPGGALQLFGELAADRIRDVDLAALQRGEPRGLVGDHLDIRRFTPGGLRQYWSKASKTSSIPGVNETNL